MLSEVFFTRATVENRCHVPARPAQHQRPEYGLEPPQPELHIVSFREESPQPGEHPILLTASDLGLYEMLHEGDTVELGVRVFYSENGLPCRSQFASAHRI